MENKQLYTKDLLMNKKEELIWKVIDNRYDDDPQYRSRNPYDDEERYHEREEYGHRERGRYGRY